MTTDPSTPSRRESRTESRSIRPGRRAVLAALTGLSVTVAGCTTADDGPENGGGETTGTETGDGDGGTTTADDASDGTTTDGEEPTEDETADGGTTTDDGETTTDGAGTGDLDLREANVTDVEFQRSGDEYRFSVELYHDDDGEEGYANWWQVETLGGERLGRRELVHAHGTQPFTRSGTVGVPGSVREVVVRGHDQTHGYGGRAAIADLETGGVEFVDQGPEPEDFSDRA